MSINTITILSIIGFGLSLLGVIIWKLTNYEFDWLFGGAILLAWAIAIFIAVIYKEIKNG